MGQVKNKTIKVYFVDFWSTFNIYDNYFINVLKDKYNIIIDSDKPDYVFHSCYSNNVYKYNKAVKIYFTGENNVPNFNLSDYSIGFNFIDFEDRYLRFPLYLLYINNKYENLIDKHISSDLSNRKFCNFVYSNNKNSNPIRNKFFLELSKYKKVDAGGALYNNIGGRVGDKLSFIKDYKFTIAFENSSVNGYTTEKIIEPMMVNSLPIYWGNQYVNRDFNRESFINVENEADFDRVINDIIYLDTNDKAYLDKLKESWFVRENEKKYWEDSIMNFFENIFDQPLEYARRCSEYGMMKNLYKEEERVARLKGNYYWGKFCGLLERLK